MRLSALVAFVCAWCVPAAAYDWNNQASSSGYHAGNLVWAAEHCEGSISAAHARVLEDERARDPAAFDEAATFAYKQTTDRAIKHALQAPEVRESGWWGTNVVCLVTEQGYGPRGVLWIGAWLPPHDRLTTAK